MASVVKTLLMKKGLTNQRLQVYIEDSTGGGLTGLLFNTASLRANYFRDGDTVPVTMTLVTATIGTYTDKGFIEIDSVKMPGLYEFDPPNAMIASGARSVTLNLGGATNMEEFVLEIQLTKMDVENGAVDLLSTGLDLVVIETGINGRQALALALAALCGEVSGADTAQITIKAADDNLTNRIVADVDTDGNRTSVTLTPPA